MLPISLTLKGLYSYQQEQTIDFTRLTEGRLFGIFGTVGSGKSAILEAISFALYGETERLNVKDNRGYNMMNLRSNELLIDFIFLAGVPEESYRCLVYGKRSKNTFDKVSSLERKLYKKINSAWVRLEETSQIEEIIGLNYKNFRRTIIIPQGKFSEFLQLTDTDRTRMLKEIFNLEKFEYYFQISSLERKNNEGIQNLNGQLAQLGDVSQEEIERIAAQLEELIKNSDELSKEIERKRELEKELSRLKDLFSRLEKEKMHLELLNTQRTFFDELDKRIQSLEFSLIYFKPLLENKRQLEDQSNKSRKDYELIRESELKLSKLYALKEQEFLSLRDDYNEKDKLKTQSDEFLKIAKIKKLDEEVHLIETRIKNGIEVIEKNNVKIQQLNAERETLKERLSVKKSGLSDFNRLNEARTWFAFSRTLKENISQTLKNIQEWQYLLNKHLERKMDEEVVGLFKEIGGRENPRNFLALLLEKKETVLTELEVVSSEYEYESLKGGLVHYAESLVEGRPCPLCGSVDHPQIADTTETKLRLEELKNRRIQLSGIIKRLEKSITREQQEVLRIEKIASSIESEQKRLWEEEIKLNLHYQKFIWPEFNPEKHEEADEVFNKNNRLAKEIEDDQKNLDILQKSIDGEVNAREKYSSALHQLNLSLADKRSESKTILSQLVELNYFQYSDFQVELLERRSRECEDKHRLIGAKYELLQGELNELKQKISLTEGQKVEMEKQLKELEEGTKLVLKQIDEQLVNSAFDSIFHVEELLGSNLNIPHEKRRVQQFQNELHTSREQFRRLEEETAGRSYLAEEHQMLTDEIIKAKEEYEGIKEAEGSLKNQLLQLEKDLEEKKKLEKNLCEVTLRAEDISVVKQLFKGSGFVNYVSSVFLQNLCNAANERFYRLTRQKLRLELNENNSFEIRDFLNNGQLRSVKTLSGGQTFQAALSLALALAESIQKQNKTFQNFFFLDEGFGSLDRESLQIVFETLKALRKENRIVGIISHVGELQQEIDLFLEVSNDEETGSMIMPSWGKPS